MQRPYDKNVMFEKQQEQNGWNESSFRFGAKAELMVWKWMLSGLTTWKHELYLS